MNIQPNVSICLHSKGQEEIIVGQTKKQNKMKTPKLFATLMMLAALTVHAANPCIELLTFNFTLQDQCKLSIAVYDPNGTQIQPMSDGHSYPLTISHKQNGADPCNPLYWRYYAAIDVAMNTTCCTNGETLVGQLYYLKNGVLCTNDIKMPANSYIGMWSVFETGEDCTNAAIETCLIRSYPCPTEEPPRD